MTAHPLILFFTLAYAWAWLVFIPLAVWHAPLEWTVLASFGPTAAAIVAHRLTAGRDRPFIVTVAWGRAVATTILGIALVIGAYVVVPALVTAGDPGRLNWATFASVHVFGYSTWLGGPVGEEPGWRGWALPRLEAAYGPIRGTLLLGLLWTGWHLPLFWYEGWTSAPPWAYALLLIGLSYLLTFAVNLARFHVLPAIVTHAAFNTVGKWLQGLFAYTEPDVRVPFEFVMALCGLAIAAVLLVATRGRLAYQKDFAPR